MDEKKKTSNNYKIVRKLGVGYYLLLPISVLFIFPAALIWTRIEYFLCKSVGIEGEKIPAKELFRFATKKPIIK